MIVMLGLDTLFIVLLSSVGLPRPIAVVLTFVLLVEPSSLYYGTRCLMVARSLLFDDLTGGPDAETVTFAVNGREWSVDLDKANRERFDRALEPFIAVARPVGRHPKPAKAGQHQASVDGAAVREWAAAQGVQVAAKGKIPTDVIEAYEAQLGSPGHAAEAPSRPLVTEQESQ
jgi:hypothetical protein